MATKPIRVGISPITKTIFAGRLNTAGDTWVGETFDVTSDCLGAVMQLIGVGNTKSVNENGVPTWEIEVRRAGVKPEGEAPQAVAPHLEPVGRVKDHFAGTDKAYRTVEWADRTFAMDVPDGASLYAAPIAAPAAQQAESGAQADRIKELESLVGVAEAELRSMDRDLAAARAALAAQSQGAQQAAAPGALDDNRSSILDEAIAACQQETSVEDCIAHLVLLQSAPGTPEVTANCRIIQGDTPVTVSQTAAIYALEAMRAQASAGHYKMLMADDASFVNASMRELERAAQLDGGQGGDHE